MAHDFRCPERRQTFLLPPDMRDWLPEDDIVHLILDAVALMDLVAFEATHKLGGAGQAPAPGPRRRRPARRRAPPWPPQTAPEGWFERARRVPAQLSNLRTLLANPLSPREVSTAEGKKPEGLYAGFCPIRC